jgi:hypothetical protein
MRKFTKACKQFDDIEKQLLKKLRQKKDFNKTQKKKFIKLLKKCILSKKCTLPKCKSA